MLELIIEAFEKLKTECLRIGAISKSVLLPKISSANISMKFSLQQAAIAIKTIESFYNSLVKFLIKYNKEPFDLMNYVNMNRIGKAERLIVCVGEKIQKLEKFSYLLRFHSLGLVFVCAVRWIKRARISLPKRANQTLDLENDSFKEVNFQKNNLELNDLNNDLEQSVPEPLFSATGENKVETVWPASPINNTFALEVSLNSTINNFISNIPKTLFTPDAINTRSQKNK